MATSATHEAILLLFRESPALAATWLRELLDADVPHFTDADLVTESVAQLEASPLLADLVVRLRDGARVVGVIVLEAQLQPDDAKRYAWPATVAFAHRMFRAPAHLLVVTLDNATAAWAARPIRVSPTGFTLTPLVLGPAAFPLVTDVEVARITPHRTVFSVFAHCREERAVAAVPALVEALGRLDEPSRNVYVDLIVAKAVEALRRAVEEVMIQGYEYQSEFMRNWQAREDAKIAAARAEARAEAQAAEKAAGILAILDARGFAVPDQVADRVRATTDLAVLDRLVRRAVTVASVEELFDE
jgi:hypothetical protein